LGCYAAKTISSQKIVVKLKLPSTAVQKGKNSKFNI